METSSLALTTPSPYVPSINTVQSVMAIVEMAYKSGMVKVKNLDDARFIALYGLELSIPVMTSLRCIYSVNGGAPTCSGELLLALIRRSGKVSIKLSSTEDTLKAEKATVYMKRLDSGDDFTATWGKADDNRAQLKSNRDKYPAQMWQWRAVSIAAKALCSDIVGGMYTIEEVYPETNLDEHGEPIGDVIVSKVNPPQIEQITVSKVEPEIVVHGPDEWINGNVSAFVTKWTGQGMTAAQIMQALKITERWSNWKGTVSEADKAVEAYRKPVTLPPDVAAAKAAQGNIIKDEKPAEVAPPVIESDPVADRLETLKELENQLVEIYYAEKRDRVAGTGKTAGDKWLAKAKFYDSTDTKQNIEFMLFPEDVTAIDKAGHNFGRTDGARGDIQVVLTIKGNAIRIKPDVPKKDTTPVDANPYAGKPNPFSKSTAEKQPADALTHPEWEAIK